MKTHPRIRLHTSLDPAQSCALALVGIEGIEPAKIVTYLWDRYRIIVTPITHRSQGVRVTPNLYTTLEEIDLFAEAMERVASNGLPATA